MLSNVNIEEEDGEINSLVAKRQPTVKHEPNEYMEGYIRKYSPALLKGWQRRLVILKDHQLRYWKEETKGNGRWDVLAGVLNFDLYRCQLTFIEKDRVFVVEVHGLDRKFEFRTETDAEFKQWVECIKHQVASSQGVLKSLAPPKSKEFWRIEQITEQQFLNMADTFDILLFHCNNAGASLTRTFTSSDYGKIIQQFEYVCRSCGDDFEVRYSGREGCERCVSD